MKFCIREGDPYIGRVTLYFIPEGAFVAAKRSVSERDFLAEVVPYLRRRFPKLLAEPSAQAEQEPLPRESPLGPRRGVRVRKRAAAGNA